MGDLRKTVAKLYEFLKTFNYLEEATKIKSNLYAEAVKLLPRRKSSDDMLEIEDKTTDDQKAAPVEQID